MTDSTVVPINVDRDNLYAARQKYLQLGREIEKVAPGRIRDNLTHTHSKLGIFLDGALGKEWRDA